MTIINDVVMLDSVKHSHVFLVKGDMNILIDTGMPGQAGKIITELKSLGADITTVRKILLTHHDVDHIGNAKALQAASGAELWAPALDVPYINGEAKRPGTKKIVSALARPQKPNVTGTYDTCRDFGGIRAISAPGHTPGHTVFLFKGVLFGGDLLRHQNGRFSVLPSFMNWDVTEARKSIGLIKTLNFDWLCQSHGEPARRDAAMEKFFEGF